MDAQLVYNNCVTFNSTAADQQTRDMTEKVSIGGICKKVCRMREAVPSVCDNNLRRQAATESLHIIV